MAIGLWFFITIFYLLFIMGLCNGRMPYQPAEKTNIIQLPSGEYTFYTYQFTSYFLSSCYQVWVRKGDSPYVEPAAESIVRFDRWGDPHVNGDTVRFYFRDRRLLHSEDQYLQFIGSEGKRYWMPAFLLPEKIEVLKL